MSMEGRSSMAQVVERPVFLKTGVPLVLSVAGLICTRFITRRCMVARVCPIETEVTSPAETHLNSHEEDEDHSQEGSDIEEKVREGELEELIMNLKVRIEELERRESEFGRLFIGYHLMKEQEIALIQLRNMLVVEIARVEFLEREVSSMMEEKKRFEVLVLKGLKVVEQLGFVKLENGILRRKVRKLLRKANRQSLVIREKDSKIEAAREEILRCRGELEERTNVIKKKEDEARELQAFVYNLQEEKDELQVKLNSAEIEEGRMRMEKYRYDELVDELEQLREGRAAKVTEKTSLKWTNACLRHELTRSRKQSQHLIDSKGNHLEPGNEDEGSPSDDQTEPNLSNEAIGSSRCAPRRNKFLRKIRRWVEGGSSGSKSKMELEEKLEGGRKSIEGVLEYAEAREEPVVRRFYASA